MKISKSFPKYLILVIVLLTVYTDFIVAAKCRYSKRRYSKKSSCSRCGRTHRVMVTSNRVVPQIDVLQKESNVKISNALLKAKNTLNTIFNGLNDLNIGTNKIYEMPLNYYNSTENGQHILRKKINALNETTSTTTSTEKAPILDSIIPHNPLENGLHIWKTKINDLKKKTTTTIQKTPIMDLHKKTPLSSLDKIKVMVSSNPKAQIHLVKCNSNCESRKTIYLLNKENKFKSTNDSLTTTLKSNHDKPDKNYHKYNFYNINNHVTHHHYYGTSTATENTPSNKIDFLPLEKQSNLNTTQNMLNKDSNGNYSSTPTGSNQINKIDFVPLEMKKYHNKWLNGVPLN